MNYNQALELAKKYHNGQFRRRSGLPYVTHPMAVADRFEDENHKIVAVLHDTIEDTELTTFDLSFTHKLNMNLVMAIQALTHLKDEPYLDYILRCKYNDIARAVKIEDIKHNLSDSPQKSKIDVYKLSLHILEN